MPRNPNLGRGFDLRTTPSDRGKHPDDNDEPPRNPDDDFDHKYWHDDQFRETYQQQQQTYADRYFPPEVQRDVYDREYGSRPSEGKRQFNQALRESFERHRIVPPWAAREEKEYEKYFNPETGQVRDGWRKHRLEGDIELSDEVDTQNPHHYPRPQQERAQPQQPVQQEHVIDRTRPGPYR